MRATLRRATWLLIVGVGCVGTATDDVGTVGSANADGPPTVASATEGLTRREGLLPSWVDAARGRVLVELPAPADETGEAFRFLYLEGLRTGVGSNPIGLDRSQPGPARLLVFRRLGRRVLVEQPNLRYRAHTEHAPERRAATESFATSVLWATEVAALDDDGRAVVDLTGFLLRDVHAVAATLRTTGQGDFELDATRSALLPGECLAFPDNLEFEAALTFASRSPGPLVRRTVPTPEAVTVRVHHSLVRLPDDGYEPRPHDPRAGAFSIAFMDYGAELDEPIETRWAERHRLRPRSGARPVDGRLPVEEPIVYYVDRGVPEPVRSALVEGAGWWSAAFEAAGFHDAFSVELLPEDVHPLDVRYNVITWVHRATRGWSYGASISDPRTGEIVRGHVLLGSLRVRQDRLLFEGLLGTEHTGDGGARDPVQLALARIRQLSAHEVGHTLGLAHNFAASTVFNGSVMDYPAPNVAVTAGGDLDVSRAYGVGVGPWDRQAVRWLYAPVPAGEDESTFLDAVVRDGLERAPPFLSDADARPAGAAHPRANLWDNGDDPVEGLRRALEVRRWALDRFDETRLAPGRPLAELQEVFATVYLHHRYQLDAAVKVVGGMEYTHALAGDGQPPARAVDDEWQRRALSAVLSVLDPTVLDVPESVLARLLPRPPGHERNRELFASGTEPAFDALGAAATAADQVARGLLQRQRCARVSDFHRRELSSVSLAEVFDGLVETTFGGLDDAGVPRLAAIREAVQRVVVTAFLDLAADARAAAAVRADAEATLGRLLDRLEGATPTSPLRRQLATDIRRFLERQGDPPVPRLGAPAPPPGSPIGVDPAILDLGRCSRD